MGCFGVTSNENERAPFVLVNGNVYATGLNSKTRTKNQSCTWSLDQSFLPVVHFMFVPASASNDSRGGCQFGFHNAAKSCPRLHRTPRGVKQRAVWSITDENLMPRSPFFKREERCFRSSNGTRDRQSEKRKCKGSAGRARRPDAQRWAWKRHHHRGNPPSL